MWDGLPKQPCFLQIEPQTIWLGPWSLRVSFGAWTQERQGPLQDGLGFIRFVERQVKHVDG